MKRTRLAAAVLMLAWGAIAGGSPRAEEPAKEPTSQGEKKTAKQPPASAAAPARAAAERSISGTVVSEPGHVYTNDDLDRLPPDPAERRRLPAAAPGKPPADGVAGKPAGEPQDALKQVEDQQARAAGINAQIGAAERRVTEADARVKDLERKTLAVKNPFLPRPEIPPEQLAEWNRMNGAERLKATEDELKQARAEAESARAALSKLRAAAGVH